LRSFIFVKMLNCLKQNLPCSVVTLVIIWLAPRAGKMNRILRCDWLPERARWSYLARSGLSAVSRKKNFPKSHVINPFSTMTAEIHARSLTNFYGQYADRHVNLIFMRRVSARERAIQQFVVVKNKLMSVCNTSVLFLTMNFVITLSK